MNGKVIAAVVVLVIATLAVVVQASISNAASVVSPSQVMAQNMTNQRLRIGGRVSESEIRFDLQPRLRLAFEIEDNTDSHQPRVPVVYYGSKPDLFGAGTNVIVEGRFVDGAVMATKVMTKCPSKYEPPKGGETVAAVVQK